VDGGLETAQFEAQSRLADAYLLAGQTAEARLIAEDLVARDPADAEQTARLRRALDMQGVDGVEGKLAGRLASRGDTQVVIETPDDSSVPAVPAGAPRQAPIPATVEIDLTSALGELEGAPPSVASSPAAPSLDAVFEGLRAEAAGDDTAGEPVEHLGLARTYLEMGMTDDAIDALEVAARSPHHRFAASSMLAQIHRDNSDLVKAIEWFERAAEAPAPTPEESRSLLYDLGDVLETVGEAARALAVFLELQTDDPGYRDVGTRVTRLSKVETEG
jgi:tetratricopeptide (TPR) repeat protein